MKWIDVNKELPPPQVKVEISYGLFGTRASVVDDWISEGWLTKLGKWSIKWKDGIPKYQNPTHWRYIKT